MEFIFKCSKCNRLVAPERKENCIDEDTSTYDEEGNFERDWMFYCENCHQEIDMDNDAIDLGEYNISLTDAKKITKLST